MHDIPEAAVAVPLESRGIARAGNCTVFSFGRDQEISLRATSHSNKLTQGFIAP